MQWIHIAYCVHYVWLHFETICVWRVTLIYLCYLGNRHGHTWNNILVLMPAVIRIRKISYSKASETKVIFPQLFFYADCLTGYMSKVFIYIYITAGKQPKLSHILFTASDWESSPLLVTSCAVSHYPRCPSLSPLCLHSNPTLLSGCPFLSLLLLFCLHLDISVIFCTHQSEHFPLLYWHI